MKKFHRLKSYSMLLVVTLTFSGCLNVRLPKIMFKQDDGSGKRLTWYNAVQEALRRNPDLEQARLNVKSSKLSRDIAFGGYLPSVDASASRKRTKSTAVGDAADSQSYEVGVTQPLYTGFHTTAEFLKAKRQWEAAQFAYEETSAGVRFSLRSAFVEVLKQKELLNVNQKIAERKKRNAEMINLRYEAGREHQGSLMRAQATSEQADFEIRQTTRRIESRSLLLSRHLGGDFIISYPIEGNLEQMVSKISSAKPDFAAMADETPQVKNLVKTAESFKAALVSAQSVLHPQIDGSYSYGYSGDRVSNLRDNSLVGISASIPLFNGGKNIEGIRKAKADYDAALQQAKSKQNQTIADLSNAWANMEDAKEFVKVRNFFLEASRKRAEIVRAQYEAGLINFQDFDIAEQELSDSEDAYIQSLSDALTQEANWNLAQGNTLEEAAYVQ